ncbi:MAG: hypothetical protein JOZ72_07250 [Alphaproteobacteria bacterium]|nr:hypothetical protein [Alphaproteobacteria bacterium]
MSNTSKAIRKSDNSKQAQPSDGAERNPEQPKRGSMPDTQETGGPHGFKVKAVKRNQGGTPR